MFEEAHTWWPYLSIEAKHALREKAGEPIPDIVREEIARITGEEVRASARLTPEAAEFIRMQREMVD